jgi:hypothetical protein
MISFHFQSSTRFRFTRRDVSLELLKVLQLDTARGIVLFAAGDAFRTVLVKEVVGCEKVQFDERQ